MGMFAVLTFAIDSHAQVLQLCLLLGYELRTPFAVFGGRPVLWASFDVDPFLQELLQALRLEERGLAQEMCNAVLIGIVILLFWMILQVHRLCNAVLINARIVEPVPWIQ